ncbi:MAG: transporter substrate-binding protein [Marmoricola sp.]|nr:transporter substrate-binding protein [Marmoricola sp.]
MASSAVRKDLKRSDYARRGLLTIVGGVVVLVLIFAKSTGAIGGKDVVSAHVGNAGGALRKGSDVKMRGVIVGRVSGISRALGGEVDVDLTMNKGTLSEIPSNVVARILPATVFGTTFVDLTTHSPDSPTPLRARAIVPADRTQGTLELQQALDDIDSLTKALGPAELASALGSAAAALDGRGAKIGETIDDLDAYLHELNPTMPVVRVDARKLVANLQLAQRALPDTLTAVDDGLTTANTIVAEKATIAAIITGGTSLVEQANRFIGSNRDALVGWLNTNGKVVDAFYDNRQAAFAGGFATDRLLASKLGEVIHHGWLDSTSIIELDVPGYYTVADRPNFSSSGARAPAGGLDRASVSSMLKGSGNR